MSRREDWPARLIAAIDEAGSKTFRWGEWDCWLFVADCVEAMTGSDPAKNVRGRYASEEEAIKIIEGYGGIDDLLHNLGFKRLDNKNFAQRGDVVVYPFTEGNEIKEAGGICVGRYALCATYQGVVHVKMEHCHKVYRVT